MKTALNLVLALCIALLVYLCYASIRPYIGTKPTQEEQPADSIGADLPE